MGRFSLFAACLLACGVVQAASREAQMELAAGVRIHYEVPFEVEHPGETVIVLEWSGPTVLSVRVDGPPPNGRIVRRSGPSPQRIELRVTEEEVSRRAPWRLTLRALPSRESGSALMKLVMPEPESDSSPEPAATRPSVPEEARSATAAPAPRLGRRSRRLPPGWKRLERAVEGFRAELDRPAADACRWQRPLLDDAAERLGRFPEAALEDPSGLLFARIHAVIDQVDALYRSDDPVLHRSPPSSRSLRSAWKLQRARLLDPVRRELDQILEDLLGGHAPELRREAWVVRLVSCLTACERSLEERATAGPEGPHAAELFDEQWARVRLAGEVLAALAALTTP